MKKKPTTSPMTLDALKAFAQRQLAHYTELVRVLDKIAADPLSVLPQDERPRRRARGPDRQPRRRAATRRQTAHEPGSPTAAAYAKAAVTKLGVASVKQIVDAARRAGWDTLSGKPDVIMHIELKKLIKAKVVRRRQLGRKVLYALAIPTKANAKKLAAAQDMLNATVAAPEAVQ